MKKCPKCGTVLDDSKKKCYMCGAQLSASVGDFGDMFNTQIGAEVSDSSDSMFGKNDGFLFKAKETENKNDNVTFAGSDFSDNFYGAEINKLNSMEYDERSGLKKGFDSVFKQNDSFKSKDDEIKRQEEVALKQKQMEEEAQRKKEEKDRIAKEKLLKKERDKQRALQEKEQRAREKAERAEALRLEKDQKEKERAEKAEALRLEKEEKERALAEEKAKQQELLQREKAEKAKIAEQKHLEEEARKREKLTKKQEEALIQKQKRESEMQAKAEEKERQRSEKQRLEEEQAVQRQLAEQERICKQEAQAEAMRIERDNAFLKKIENESSENKPSKPSINWGDGLVDSNVDGYQDKVNKANKKINVSSIFNFLCVIFFIGAMVFVYFNYLRPEDNKDVNLGGLIYTVDEDFKLSNNDGATKYYTYGESCGLRVTYGATNDTDGFVDNYFNKIKTQFESDMNSFTEKSTLKINGNTWSELSVVYLEDGASAELKENIIKYRYVSIVYKGNFYHTVFVNPNNDKKCYEMYQDFIQTMKFE